MNALNIIENAKLQIYTLHRGHKVLLNKGKTPLNCINYFNLPFTDKSWSIKLNVWTRPSFPWVKLNVDRASKGMLVRQEQTGLCVMLLVTNFWLL